MLFNETVAPATLASLRKLCNQPMLLGFALGGDTGLALQRGHRISVDLDFFTNQPFSNADKYRCMPSLPEKTELLFEQNQTIMFVIGDIKVDFILYPFTWLQPFVIMENFRLIPPGRYNTHETSGSKQSFCQKRFL